MVLRVGPQALLDAIDGVTYVVDRYGIIRAIGTQAWERFAAANGSPELTADRVIGTSLFAGMAGIAVRDVCRRLHALVCLRRREMITYEYRCDAPDGSADAHVDPSGCWAAWRHHGVISIAGA